MKNRLKHILCITFSCKKIKIWICDSRLTDLILHFKLAMQFLPFIHAVLFMVALWNRAYHIYLHAVVCSFMVAHM